MRGAAFATVVVLLAGCGGDEMVKRDCRSQCASDPLQSARSYCGTDGKTYSGCEWACGPMNVGVFPGACQPNGAPTADAPPLAADGIEICDWVEIDGQWEAVECAAELTMPPAIGAALNPGDSVGGAAPPATMPTDVDHRARFLGVRQQGSVPACTAFGAVGALEGAIVSATGEKLALSEMHLWARYHKPQLGPMAMALEKGLASTQTATTEGLPWDDALAATWESGKSMPDAAKLATLDGKSDYALGGLMVITADKIKPALAEGLDVFVAMNVEPAFMNVDRSGVVADYQGSAQKMGHAMLLVGYRQLDGKTYFIVRNSWGAGWGDGGYGYVSETTVNANLQAAFVVAVRRPPTVTVQSCPMGQAAGLDGSCRMRCIDGSLAATSGQCSDAPVSCPSGQTADASNVCVAACTVGMTSGTGFSADCTARGCTWTIQPGMLGCDGMQPCARFCAAPTCQATTAPNELGATIPTCAARTP